MTTADGSEGADVQWSDGGYWIRSGPPLLHLRGAEYGARMLAELLAGAELNGRQGDEERLGDGQSVV